MGDAAGGCHASCRARRAPPPGAAYPDRWTAKDLRKREVPSGLIPALLEMVLVSSKAILLLVCTVAIGFAGCEEDSVSPPPAKQRAWWLEPDSMNLGILVLDRATYDLEGGRIDHFALCDTCDRDSLPFEHFYRPPVDFGDVTFTYTHTGDTLLYATTIWAGQGHIEYPAKFLLPSEFEELPWRFAGPLSIEYFYNSGKTDPFAAADTAWSLVASLDIVGEFAKSEYRVGVYLHNSDATDPDPEPDSWVIFLYRGQAYLP
jgi:hypothetical protein